MTADIKQLSALTALNSMMAGGHFNICCIDSVADLLGAKPKGSEAYKTLAPLHCINWALIPEELREAIPGLIQECLGISVTYRFRTARQEVIDVMPAKPKLLRLFGGRA